MQGKVRKNVDKIQRSVGLHVQKQHDIFIQVYRNHTVQIFISYLARKFITFAVYFKKVRFQPGEE